MNWGFLLQNEIQDKLVIIEGRGRRDCFLPSKGTWFRRKNTIRSDWSVVDSSDLGNEKRLVTDLADYMYQIPTIAGEQIRINRLSDTNRLFFKLENDLTGNITISTDKLLVDIDQNPITQLEKGFVEVIAHASFFILRNKGISLAD